MKAKLIFLLLSLTGIINVSSCRKEPINEMPPETQTGANTFGCLIDDELFVGGCCAPWMQSAIGGEYHSISKKLYFGAYGKIGNKAAGDIYMQIDTPQENITQKFTEARYAPDSDLRPQIATINGIGYCLTLSTANDGTCVITKFDTIKKIVSGRFEFIGICTSNSDSTVTKHITEGRFDLKFDIINE